MRARHAVILLAGATYVLTIPACVAAQSCRMQRCTVPADLALQATAGCKLLWSSPDDNAVAAGCAAFKINDLPKTCRVVRYDCDDLAASLFGIVPGGDDDYVVEVNKLP